MINQSLNKTIFIAAEVKQSNIYFLDCNFFLKWIKHLNSYEIWFAKFFLKVQGVNVFMRHKDNNKFPIFVFWWLKNFSKIYVKTLQKLNFFFCFCFYHPFSKSGCGGGAGEGVISSCWTNLLHICFITLLHYIYFIDYFDLTLQPIWK